MPQIALTDEDADILREVAEARLVELRREIAHTDSHRFRERLYRIDAALVRLIEQLPRRVPIQG